MRKLIYDIFADFKIADFKIPVWHLHYSGPAKTYVTFQRVSRDEGISADNKLIAYTEYYDFDVFSKDEKTFSETIDEVKKRLKNNGFRLSLTKSSGEMYEPDTKFYHETLCFYKIRS